MSLNVAVIGCGNISKFHFNALAELDVEISWVCDLHEAAARPWAERFGARICTDYRQAVDDPAVGVVLITTISATHREICLRAIGAGKAVICEKTLGENPADALAITQAAAEKGTLFYTSYMKRFIPAVEKAKELLPALGTIVSSHFRVYQNWGNLWDQHPEQGFFHTPANGTSMVKKNYGGGILVCGGSHLLDLVGHFLGRPSRLYGTMVVPDGRDYDLQAMAILDTEHGRCCFEAMAHGLKGIGFLRDGWEEEVEITGTKGRLQIYSSEWNDVEAKSSLLVHTDLETGSATEHRFAPASPFKRALAHFLGQIAQGEQGPQAITTGYDVDLLIAAIVDSSQQQRPVNLNWKV